MTFFLRYFLPFTYFQASRLNRWRYLAYHALLEWLPAMFLAMFFNDYYVPILGKLLLSYLAFICLYEIGYITNDFFSEKFESDPRERSQGKEAGNFIIWSLIVTRIAFFLLISFLLDSLSNKLWLTFHSMMLLTFIFHNVRIKEYRISSFFGLTVFRFLAPLLLCLPESAFFLLIPTVMINYSLYRVITYGTSKKLFDLPGKNTFNFKLSHYLNILPLCVLISVAYASALPVIFCLYYISIWITFHKLAKVNDNAAS